MKYKVGDRVEVKSEFDFYEEYRGKQFVIEECDSSDDTYLCHLTTGGYRIWLSNEMLEPVCADGGFCAGFKGGKKPEYVLNEKQAKEYADKIMATAESISNIAGISYENSINKLKACLGTFPNNGISAKNGGKNPMKFTFYVTEGYRIDKSNNTRIPTMTTEVLVNGKDYQYGGSATCDKTDYEEREGVLNAIANAVCGGNFDREFSKVMKNKAFANKKAHTCTYCGQLFDTIAEKEAHEDWHVERRKARHERYLLRKRAKEIAFEEQAQKMAKEMIKEDK